MVRISTLCSVAVAVSFACTPDRAGPTSETLAVQPTSVDFGFVQIGQRATRALRIINSARLEQAVQVNADAPFGASAPALKIPAGGSVELELTFEPNAEGSFAGTLVITWGTSWTQSIPLAARGVACPIRECTIATVDSETGVCATTPAPDATACGDACDSNGVCLAGSCHFSGSACDDGDACTVDACDPAVGCVHAPVQCAPSDTTCMGSVCDPQLGCTTTPVADGTTCGRRDCDVADVCLQGSCVATSPPEGASCGEATPCRGMGTCHQGSCSYPPVTDLAPVWTRAAQPRLGLHSFVAMDENGFVFYVDTSNQLVSFDASGADRFTVPLTGLRTGGDFRLLGVDAGLVLVAQDDGVIAAHRAQDGAQVWSVDISHALVPPSDGPWAATAKFALRGDKDTVRLVVDRPVGSPYGVASYFHTVDLARADGSVVRSLAAVGSVFPPVADEDRNLFIDDTSSYWATLSVRSDLQEDDGAVGLARTGCRPLAAHEGEVVVAKPCWGSYRRLESLDHTTLSQTASFPALKRVDLDGYESVLVGNGVLIAQRADMDEASPNCDPLSYNLSYATSDWATGAELARTYSWDDPVAKQAALLSDGRALFLMRFRDLRDYLELYADGRSLASCMAPIGFDLDRRTVMLHDGTWIAFERGSSSFVAFDVAGLKLAEHGWVTLGGNQQRTHTALP